MSGRPAAASASDRRRTADFPASPLLIAVVQQQRIEALERELEIEEISRGAASAPLSVSREYSRVFSRFAERRGYVNAT